MGKKKMLKIEFPIFSIGCLDDYVIVSGGGGGKKYGLRNKIAIYKRGVPVNELKNRILEVELPGEDIIENLSVH